MKHRVIRQKLPPAQVPEEDPNIVSKLMVRNHTAQVKSLSRVRREELIESQDTPGTFRQKPVLTYLKPIKPEEIDINLTKGSDINVQGPNSHTSIIKIEFVPLGERISSFATRCSMNKSKSANRFSYSII